MRINEIGLQDLRYLVVLAEELNFSRAAERLHISQPPLTRLVADLEQAFGARLFERTTRRVSLTPLGEVFVAEARAILARTETAWQTVTTAIERQRGQLRLAYTPLALQSVLPRLLATFREYDHEARIDLIELSGTAQIAALDAGHVDIAFTDEPVNSPDYHSLLVHEESLALAVPPGHALNERNSVALAELGDETFILHPRHEYPRYYDHLMAAFAADGIRPSIRQREEGENCAALMLSGAGLLLVPKWSNYYTAAALQPIELATTLPLVTKLWMVWQEDRIEGSAARLVRITQRELAAHVEVT